MILKVGRDLLQGTEKKLSYKDTQPDKQGWVSAKRFVPPDYELVMIRFSTEKTTYGWTHGDKWQGVLVTPETEVVAWKRKIPDFAP